MRVGEYKRRSQVKTKENMYEVRERFYAIVKRRFSMQKRKGHTCVASDLSGGVPVNHGSS